LPESAGKILKTIEKSTITITNKIASEQGKSLFAVVLDGRDSDVAWFTLTLFVDKQPPF
jgi:hypothetical protein